jgi:pantoate--beta-alanine ligase
METIHTIRWMKEAAKESLINERPLGLVPTMGALHEGHFSLVREAKLKCSPVVVSIFVNPKQFGPAEDLKKYPRMFEADREALTSLGADILFAPSTEEMYPNGFSTSVTVKGLSDRWEGHARPGHFDGVATVVLKLFEIVQPRVAFFGRKDAQQARVIQQMVADLNLDTKIDLCPIVREPDGLALSSRNVYLSPDDRRAATAISRSLAACKGQIESGERDVARLLATLRSKLDSGPRLTVDYAEIVGTDTLDPLRTIRGNCYALVAATVGGTRLIDNAYIEQADDRFHVVL